jgi:hypothetical protein
MREREEANRTREAGHLDEIHGVVASTLDSFRNGASLLANSFGVGFIDWLDRPDGPNENKKANQRSCDNSTRDYIRRVARFRTALCKINDETEGESIQCAGGHRGPPSSS